MALLHSVRTQREISFSQALIFAAQAVTCTLAALAIYYWAGAAGGMWAAVSAVLVLQPGVHQSLAASFVRVLANLIGVGTGVIVSMLFGRTRRRRGFARGGHPPLRAAASRHGTALRLRQPSDRDAQP